MHHVDIAQARRRRDARENREKLLSTAEYLFRVRGVEPTTMKDIAEAAQVGKGTLYRNFEHKAALCFALAEAKNQAFRAHLDAQIRDTAGSSALDRLDHLLTAWLDQLESNLSLLAEIVGDQPGTTQFANEYSPLDQWMHTRTTMLLNDAVALGEIKGIDVEISAATIVAAVGTHIYLYQRRKCNYSRERVHATIRRLFIAGLR